MIIDSYIISLNLLLKIEKFHPATLDEKRGDWVMKRIASKWCSLLLAGLLLLTAVPVAAFAQESEPAQSGEYVYQWGDGETGYVLRETTDTLGGGEEGYSAAETFSAPIGSYDDGSFYGQLTSRQKACYNALADIPLNQILTAAQVQGYRQVQVIVDGFSGVTMTGSIQDNVFYPDAASEASYRSMFTDICAAIVALRYDRADAFWLSDMRYGVVWEATSYTSVKTRNVVLAFRMNYGGQEGLMWNQQMESARAIANQVDRSADRYTQLKQVHDLLAAQSTYNYEPADATAEDLSHQAFSCLVAGDAYEPVCDGYSKAMKVVCDLLEIPCVLATSDTHMWNNIKMDDGDWYNLDLTWDDGNDNQISYDYFLVGSLTEVNGQVFSREKDHVEADPWMESSDLNHVTLRYPTKNQQAYQYQEGGYTPLRFPDVKRSYWYYDYVENAASMGLFAGDENGFFQPEADITRAQFVQVLYNALAPEDYVPGELSFTDVKAGDWFANAVSWAGENQIVSGYQDGTFRPNALITREEMCVVLENYIQNASPNVPEHKPFTFPDDSKISSWAEKAVYACYDRGLISGDDQGKFNPGSNTARCEAATVFVKYLDHLGSLEAA